jgi:hypothetical protein
MNEEKGMKAGWMTMPLAFVATFAFLFAVSTSGAGVDPGGTGGTDVDGDGYQENIDNCSSDSNASQTDSDNDGYGNACDGDFDQDGVAGIPDFGIFKASFGLTSADPGFNKNTDCNDDDVNGVPDFGCFKAQFINGLAGGAGGPGPSGLSCSVAAGSPQFGSPTGPQAPCPDPDLIVQPRAFQLP